MTTTAPPALIRKWAREHGIPVGDRGRLSPEVVAAYGQATAPSVAAKSVVDEPPARTAASTGTGLRLRVRPTVGAAGIARTVRARTS